jgi:hypothetical protein
MLTFPVLTFGINGQGNQEYRSPRNNHMPIWHVGISCAQIKARAPPRFLGTDISHQQSRRLGSH